MHASGKPDADRSAGDDGRTAGSVWDQIAAAWQNDGSGLRGLAERIAGTDPIAASAAKQDESGLYRNLEQRNGRCYVRFQYKRHKLRRSLGIPATPKYERVALIKVEEEIESFKKRVDDGRPKEILFEDLVVQRYLDEYKRTHKTSSWESARSCLLRHSRWFPGMKVHEIKTRHINQRVRRYLANGDGPTPKQLETGSANHALGMLTGIFKYAVDEGYIDSNPVREATWYKKTRSNRPRAIEVVEELKLLPLLPFPYRQLSIFGKNTGLRLDNIYPDLTKDLFLDEHRYAIPDSKTSDWWDVGLNDEAERAIKEVLALAPPDSNFIFTHPDGKPVDGQAARKALKIAVAAAGIAPCTPRHWRHTWKTRGEGRYGIPGAVIEYIMGHLGQASRGTYFRPPLDILIRAARRFQKRDEAARQMALRKLTPEELARFNLMELCGRARVAWFDKRWEEAKNLVREAMKLAPENPEVLALGSAFIGDESPESKSTGS